MKEKNFILSFIIKPVEKLIPVRRKHLRRMFRLGHHRLGPFPRRRNKRHHALIEAKLDPNAAVLVPGHHAVPGEDGFVHRVCADDDLGLPALDVDNLQVVDMIEVLAEDGCRGDVCVDVAEDEDPGRAMLDLLLDELAKRELLLRPFNSDLE